MKKIVNFFITFFVFISVSLYADGIESIVPAESEVLIKFSSLEKYYKNFQIKSSSIFGEKIKEVKEIKKNLGFNPLNLTEMKNVGFSVDREVGIVLSNVRYRSNRNDIDMNFQMLMPVANEDLVLGRLIKLVKKKSKNISISKENDLTIITNKLSGKQIFIYNKNKYLIFVLNTGETTNIKKSVLEFKNSDLKLNEDINFKNACKKIDNKEDFFVYVNTEKIIERNYGEINRLMLMMSQYNSSSAYSISMIKDYKNFALNVDLDDKDLTVNFLSTLKQGSKSLNLLNNVKVDNELIKGITKDPLLSFFFAMNFRVYYEQLFIGLDKNSKNDINSNFKIIKKTYGIDIKRDIVDNLKGNVNVAVFDSKTISFSNQNLIITIGLKNINKMKSVLEKIEKKMGKSAVESKEIGGIETKIFRIGPVKLYIGFKSGKMVIAAGENIYLQLLNGNKNNGFIDNISDKELLKVMLNGSDSFYLSVDELRKMIENFPFLSKTLLDEDKKFISFFKYLLVFSKKDKNVITSKLLIRTRFKDNFLISIVESGKKLKKAHEIENRKKIERRKKIIERRRKNRSQNKRNY